MKITSAFFSVSGVYGCGIFFSVLGNVLLARWLSVESFGFYSLAIAVATLVAIPVSAGLPLLMTREVSHAMQASDTSGIWRLLAVAGAWVFFAGGLAALGLQSARLAVGISPQLAGPLSIAGFLPLAMGIVAVTGGTLKGMGLPVFSELLAQIIVPCGLVAGLALLHAQSRADTESALTAHLIAYVVAALIGLVLILQKTPSTAEAMSTILARTEQAQLHAWGTAFLSFTLIGGMGTLSAQLATLALGVTGQATEMAYLRVAERGAQLVAFPLMFVNAVIGPYIVQSRAEGAESLRALARHSARLATFTALPIALIFAIAGRPLIAVTFGEPYPDTAYLPMMIMVAGQVLSLALGSGGMFLAMCGHERASLFALDITVLATTTGTFCLAPFFGATGVAIGVFLGLFAGKIVAAAMCKARLGILPTFWN